MCDPVSISMAVVAVVSAVAAAKSAQQQAAAAQSSALAGFNQNQIAVGVQQQQQGEAASAQASARAIETERQRGRLAAIGADNGQGNSLDRQFGEVSMVGATDQAVISHNLQGAIQQGQLQKAGMRAQSQGTINQNPGPSNLNAGLMIGSAALSAYGGSPYARAPQQKISSLQIPYDSTPGSGP